MSALILSIELHKRFSRSSYFSCDQELPLKSEYSVPSVIPSKKVWIFQFTIFIFSAKTGGTIQDAKNWSRIIADKKNIFFINTSVCITELSFKKMQFAQIDLIFILAVLIIVKPSITSCKRSRKSVSLLLLVILACTTPLINCYFLIFSLLSLLVLLTLQFSMGFSKAVIQIKSCLFAVSVVYGYLTIHLIQNPELCRQIVDWFSLPAKWW